MTVEGCKAEMTTLVNGILYASQQVGGKEYADGLNDCYEKSRKVVDALLIHLEERESRILELEALMTNEAFQLEILTGQSPVFVGIVSRLRGAAKSSSLPNTTQSQATQETSK